MADLEAQIDELYRLKPSDFTAARNTLAKAAGARAAEIRALQKPNLPAWTVNQLYWRYRKLFDALAAASAKRRAAHVQRIAGRAADMDTAEARHRAALDAAMQAARTLLEQENESTSVATLSAVRHTLEAVPSPDITGRLTRPIEPVGFSMLAGLMASARSTKPPADVVVMPRTRRPGSTGGSATKDHESGTRELRRAEAARRQERVRLERALANAKAREKDAEAKLTQARQAITKADERIDRLENDLREARNAAHARREELNPARGAVNDAAAERVELERALRVLE